MTNWNALDEALVKLAELGPRHSQGTWLEVDHDALDQAHETHATYEFSDGETFKVTGSALRDEWSCRTTGCLAGWVAIWAGWTPLCENGGASTSLVSRAGVAREVQDVACELLDLTVEQANDLFYATDLDELREIAASLRERDEEDAS